MATDLDRVQAEERFIKTVLRSRSRFFRPDRDYEGAEWLVTLAKRLYSYLERSCVETRQLAAEEVRRWTKRVQENRRQTVGETGSYSKGTADWPENVFSEPTPWAADFKLTVAIAIHDYFVGYLGANAERVDPFGDVERIDAAAVPDRDWLGQLCLFHNVVKQLTWADERFQGIKLVECVDYFEQWCERHFDPASPPNRRRGRKKPDFDTRKREAKLAAEWRTARDAGVYKAVFAKGKNLKTKDLDKLLARVRKRNSRAD